MTRSPYLVGFIGWAATTATVVAADMIAVRTGHATMSRTLGHFLGRPLVGPILAGAWSGLSYHLLIEELIPALLESAPTLPNPPVT